MTFPQRVSQGGFGEIAGLFTSRADKKRGWKCGGVRWRRADQSACIKGRNNNQPTTEGGWHSASPAETMAVEITARTAKRMPALPSFRFFRRDVRRRLRYSSADEWR